MSGTPNPPAPSATLPTVQQQLASSLSQWIFAQDKLATAAMLCAGVMFATAVYAMFWVAPDQLAEIRKGYERIEASHVIERESAERRHQEHFSEMLSKVEAVTKMQSQLIEKLILREQGR